MLCSSPVSPGEVPFLLDIKHGRFRAPAFGRPRNDGLRIAERAVIYARRNVTYGTYADILIYALAACAASSAAKPRSRSATRSSTSSSPM